MRLLAFALNLLTNHASESAASVESSLAEPSGLRCGRRCSRRKTRELFLFREGRSAVPGTLRRWG